MAAILFKARLINEAGTVEAELARILFGVDSVEDKEKVFRTLCQTIYPQLQVQEPLNISPANSR